jgi:hypothetical protein
MKQLFYFVMVGLAFTVLQVVTVEAQEVDLDIWSLRCAPRALSVILGVV